MHGIQGFLNGAGAFARGLGFLGSHRRLIPLLAVPVVLNLILYVGAFYLGYQFAASVMEPDDASVWWWAYGLKYVSWIGFWAVMVLVSFVTFVPVGSIVTAPFAELISGRVEAALLPASQQPGGGVRGFLADIWLGVSHALVRLLIFALLLLLILPFFLLPVAGGALMVYVSARYLAWDGLDYALARRRMTFSRKSDFLREHRARTLGLGAAAYVLFLVPFTALFVLPMLAVSGTVLFCEIENERSGAAREGELASEGEPS